MLIGPKRIRQFLFAPRNQRQAIPVSPLVAAIDRNADGRITVDELSRAGEVMKELEVPVMVVRRS